MKKKYIYIIFLSILSKITLASITSIINNSEDFKEKNEFEICDNFVNLCMDIWTQVDIIRAINTTDAQKKQFIDDMADIIVKLHYQMQLIKQNVSNKNILKQYNLEDLVQCIENSFNDVFPNIASSGFTTISFLLSKIKNGLNFPSDLTTEITT